MDSTLLTLYVTLKGLSLSSKLLDVPESKLSKCLSLPGSQNLLFYGKVIECIQSLCQTSNLKIASEYFNIPEELTRSLIDQNYNPPFLHIAKELLSRSSKNKCNKETQTISEDTLQLPFKTLPPPNNSINASKDLTRIPNSLNKPLVAKPNSSPSINVRKVINILLLTHHSPSAGLITNPDYSYNPGR